MATPFPLFEGKYEIITKLKEGGMGAVYKVRHRLLDEVRVIKLIRPHLESDEGIRARFLREARTAVRLRHANIAQFYDFSMDEEGNAFIVMEFIEGITLEEMIARVGPPPLALALEIAEQSLQPIGYLHRRNTIHRDISPDNLMLSRNDDGLPLVKLIDLGIAKVLEEEGQGQITRRGLTGTGMFLGKVRYASPEQFHAQEGVGMDARSDLYSFGLVLYELLTGKHPIRGTSVPSFIAGHLFNPPLPFSETDPEGRLPEDLREVVLCTLAKSPDARFASAEALVKALAPIKARFPLSPEDAVVALDGITAVFTERTLAGVPGSTQARLDRQFGIAPTPPPSPLTPAPPVKDAGAPASPPPLPAEPQPSRSEDVFGAREDDTRPVVVRSPEVEPAQDEPTRRQQRDEDTRVLTIPGADAERVAPLLAEVRRLCVDAESHLAAGRLAQARQAAEQACELRPEDLPAAAVLADVREAESRREAEQRLREQRDGAIESIRSALTGGELEAAGAGIATAQAAFGNWPEMDAVRGEHAAACEAARKQATADLLTQARELSGLLQLDAAEARLNEAQELSPHDERVLDALVELRAVARKHREAQERARAVEEETAAVAHALDEENLELAAERFDALVRKHGDRLDLGELRRRLREVRQAEEEKRATQRQAAAPSMRRDRKEIEKATTLPLLREEAVAAAEGEGAPEKEAVTDVTRVSVEPEGEERRETPVAEVAPAAAEIAPEVGAPEAAAVELDLGARQPEKAVIVALPKAAAPVRKPPRSKRPQVQPPVTDGEKVVSSGRVPARRRWPLRAGVAAAVAVLALTAVLLRPRPAPRPGPVPTPVVGTTAVPVTPAPVPGDRGGLLLTAIPWAEVVAIVGSDGRTVDLPAVRITPLRIEVPAGRYEITLRDPASGEQRTRAVEVVAGKKARAVVEMRAVSVEELLRSFGWSG